METNLTGSCRQYEHYTFEVFVWKTRLHKILMLSETQVQRERVRDQYKKVERQTWPM